MTTTNPYNSRNFSSHYSGQGNGFSNSAFSQTNRQFSSQQEETHKKSLLQANSSDLKGVLSKGQFDSYDRKLVDAALEKNPEKIKQIYQDLSKNFTLSVFMYASLIQALIAADQGKEAENAFQEMKLKGMQPNQTIYLALLHEFRRQGKCKSEEEALLLREMEKNGFSSDKTVSNPELIVCNKAISYAANNRNVIKAQEIFKQIISRKLEPDIYSYTSLMKAFCKDKQFFEVQATFDQMQGQGIEPNVIAYNILLTSLIKQNKQDEALILLKLIRDKGISNQETERLYSDLESEAEKTYASMRQRESQRFQDPQRETVNTPHTVARNEFVRQVQPPFFRFSAPPTEPPHPEKRRYEIEKAFIRMLEQLGAFPDSNYNDFYSLQNPNRHILGAIDMKFCTSFQQRNTYLTQMGALPFEIDGIQAASNGTILNQFDDILSLHLLLRYLPHTPIAREHFTALFNKNNFKLIINYQRIEHGDLARLGYRPCHYITLDQLDWSNVTNGNFLKLFSFYLSNTAKISPSKKDQLSSYFSTLEKREESLKFTCLLYQSSTDEYPTHLTFRDEKVSVNHSCSPLIRASIVWFLHHLETEIGKKTLTDILPLSDLLVQTPSGKILEIKDAIQWYQSFGRIKPRNGLANSVDRSSTTTTTTLTTIKLTVADAPIPIVSTSMSEATAHKVEEKRVAGPSRHVVTSPRLSEQLPSEKMETSVDIEPDQQEAIKPLLQLLQEKSELKGEAERLFKSLSDRFFSRRAMLYFCLLPHRGLWKFEFEQETFLTLLSILKKFVNENKTNKLLALSVVLEFIQYIPLRGVVSDDQLDAEGLQIANLLDEAEAVSVSNGLPLELELTRKIIPIFILAKSIELAKMPLTTPSADLPAIERQIPCYVINCEQDVIRLDFLLAHFSEGGLLMGVTKDFTGLGEKLLLEHNLLERNPANSSGSSMIKPEKLDGLRKLLEASRDRIPPFLIFEPESSSPSSPDKLTIYEKETSPKKQSPGGTKRKREEVLHPDRAEELFIKKRKIVQTNSHSRKKNEASPLMNRSTPQEQIQWDTLWTNFSLNAVGKAAAHFQSGLRRSRGPKTTGPLKYPILDLIAIPSYQGNFTPLNRILKPYQIDEVKNLLDCSRRGYSRLLAFEMGVGKSLVIIEYMLQNMLKAPAGKSLVVIPLSVAEQMMDELKKHCALVSAAAWIQKQRQGSLSKITLRFGQVCKDKNIHETLSYLPLLALYDAQQIYYALDGKLPKETSLFWTNLSEMLESILSPLVAGKDEIERNARSVAAQKVLTNENEIRPIWEKYFKEAPLKDLLPGTPIKNASKQMPFIIAQLCFAGNMMLKGIQNKEFNIPLDNIEPLTDLQSKDFKLSLEVGELEKSFTSNSKFIVTSYETFMAISEELLCGGNINCVVFDEAQRMHTDDTKIAETCRNRVKMLKEKNPALATLLSTGTFLENDPSELVTLLELANPSMFDEHTVRELLANLVEPQTHLRSGDQQEFSRAMIKAFVHVEVFRREIVLPLLARKKRNHPQVVGDWGGIIPTRIDNVIRTKISPSALAMLKQAHDELKKKENSIMYTIRVSKILLHQDLYKSKFNLNDPTFKTIINMLKSNDRDKIEAWIKESTIVSHLLNAPLFVEMFEKKENALILSAYHAEAEIIRWAILSRHKEEAEVEVFKGGLNEKERNRVISWFRKPQNNKIKILIVLKKAGGLGLNLSEAKKVFRISDDWNPSVDDQAEGRAMRINSAGERVFSSFYHQTFRDHHLKAVRDGKIAAELLFNDEKDADLMQQLRYFGNYILERCYKSELYASKDIKQAIKKRTQMEDFIDHFYETVDSDKLALDIVSSTPKPQYPSTIPRAKGGILPIAYKVSFDETIKYAYLLQKQPQKMLSLIDKIPDYNWREELRKETFSIDHQEDKLALWQEIRSVTRATPNMSLEEIKKTHTLVFYCANGEGNLNLQKIENPGKPNFLLFYRKKTARGWHHDLFIQRPSIVAQQV